MNSFLPTARFNEASYSQYPDQRLAHAYQPNQPVSVDELRRLGILYWYIPTSGWEPQIDLIARQRGYKNRDRLNAAKESLGASYETMLRMFFNEHLHEDEEIRYVIGGSAYFDVRDFKSDKWIRIKVEPNDLIVLPAGLYHRFTLDKNNAVDLIRLFKEEPKWMPHNRSPETETNPFRVNYIREISSR
ncbi:Acireductone dioxygenase [Clavulina sp. PMI_390]|nr:Acireductone dioxygenase [Clavulina sp. PMI_390]